MEQKLVSIIIPVYKVEKYLHKCLDSVLNQDYDNLEIILVDDGSPDRCPLICDEYAKLDNRVRVIHQSNSGVSVARNKGLALSHGDYVYFMDSDDYVEKQMVGMCVETLEKSKCESVVFNFVREDEDGLVIATSSHKATTYYTNNERERAHFIEFILLEFQLFGWSPWQRFYKKSFLCQHNLLFPDEIKIAEDFNHYLRAASYQTSVICIEDSLYHYVIRNNSAMRTEEMNGRIAERIRLCKDFEDFIVDRGLFRKNRKDIIRCLNKYIFMSINNHSSDLKTTLSLLPSYVNVEEKNIFVRWLRNSLCHPFASLYRGGGWIYCVAYHDISYLA